MRKLQLKMSVCMHGRNGSFISSEYDDKITSKGAEVCNCIDEYIYQSAEEQNCNYLQQFICTQCICDETF